MAQETPPPKAERLNLDGFVRHVLEINAEVQTERFCWILGAGCSVTSGIPAGGYFAGEWLRKLHDEEKDPGETLEQFCTRLPQLSATYKLDFTRLDHRNPAAHYSELYDYCFRRSVKQGFSQLERAMRGKDPGLGYTILARFLAETRHRVVITTNFDNLIADAVAIHTSVFPMICGHESMVQYLKLEDARPLVLKVHRDLLLDPLSRKAELDRLHSSWKPALDELLAGCTPIIIGYEGNDGSLMRYLKTRQSLAGHFYWCHRMESEPRPEIHAVVRHHGGALVPIEGFDELMLRLGTPLRYDDPLTTMRQRFEQRMKTYTEQLDVLQKKIAAASQPGSGAKKPDAALQQAVSQVVKQAEKAVDWWAWEQKAEAEKDPDRKNMIYQEGIQVCPKSAKLHRNYAIFLWGMQNQEDRAELFYRKAWELDSSDASIVGSYASFLENIRKDFDQAEALYRRALELDANDALATGNYALFLHTIRKDYDCAEALYRKALELDANDAYATGDYACFLHTVRKDYDRAEVLYRKALELNPGDAEQTGDFARFLKDIRKDFDQCEALLRKALELEAKSANILAIYAEYLLEMKRGQEGEEQLRLAWMKKALDDKELLLCMAYLRAMASWGHADELGMPDATGLRKGLGWAKYLIEQGVRQPRWLFDSLHGILSSGWPTQRKLFARTLADVVSDKAPPTALDAFPEWRETVPLPPTAEW